MHVDRLPSYMAPIYYLIGERKIMMYNLFNGSQFNRLFNEQHKELQRKYNIEKIDIKVIRNIRQGIDNNLLKDLIELGVYDDRELADSITRLHKQGIIELTRSEKDIHAVAFKLTRVGNELWKQINNDYEKANEILFRGMTEEQVATYKRLSQIVINNIDKEVNKRDCTKVRGL